MGQLSQDDVAALLSSAATPEAAAVRLSRSLAETGLTREEIDVAGELLRRLLDDASVRIRQAIADTVKNSVVFPHDLAVKLAQDVDSVAVPILEHSSVLTDQDLIDVIHSDAPEKQVAVARRRTVGDAVVGELIQTNNNRAVGTLMRNKGAAINETHLETIASRFGEDPGIVAVLTRHPAVTAHLADRLREFTAATLIDYLTRNPALPDEPVSKLVLKTREELNHGLPSNDDAAGDVIALVDYLAKAGRLSPHLILRALCTGDIELFEVALARCAKTPLQNARQLIHDAGPLGLKSIYLKAELPGKLLPAVRTSLDVLRGMSLEGQPFDRTRYQAAILERLLTQFSDLDPEDLDYLLIRLNR